MSVNGTLASISNRSYAVIDAPLNLGKNTITAIGSDQDYNIGSSFINDELYSSTRKTAFMGGCCSTANNISSNIPNKFGAIASLSSVPLKPTINRPLALTLKWLEKNQGAAS